MINSHDTKLNRENVPIVSCIVLAAGSSSRYGENKLLEKLNGKTLFEHTMDKLPFDELFEVVVVTAYEEVKKLSLKYPVKPVMIDSISKSYSIKQGLKHISDADGCLFIVCDQPLLKKATIKSLIEAFKSNPKAVWDISGGNPKVIPNSILKAIDSRDGDAGFRDIINSEKIEVNSIEPSDLYELMDVDNKENLEEIRNVTLL